MDNTNLTNFRLVAAVVSDYKANGGKLPEGLAECLKSYYADKKVEISQRARREVRRGTFGDKHK